jgi:hypothetical protein
MRNTLRIAFAILISCILCAGLSFCIKNLKVAVSETASPDNRFAVVVYVYRRIISEGVGGPGLICLHDKRSGTELQRIRTESIGAIDRIEWSPTNVFIAPIIVWPLPPVKNSFSAEKHETD